MANIDNKIVAVDDNATMAAEDQTERVGSSADSASTEQLPFTRQLREIRGPLTRKRALEEEARKAQAKQPKKDESDSTVTSSEQPVHDSEENPSPLSSPASTLSFPYKRSDSEVDLNDEEVALLMAAPPTIQGNQSAKNSPTGEHESVPPTSDEGSAGSELTAHNPSPANDSPVKNEETSD